MPSVEFLAGLMLGFPAALLLARLVRIFSVQKTTAWFSSSVPAHAPNSPAPSFKVPPPSLADPAAGKARPVEQSPNRDFQSTRNRLARLQARRNGHTLLSSSGDPLFMVASECIAFVGSEEECSRFLTERGVVTLESAIEPLDLRIQENMDVLGMRVINCRDLASPQSA